MGSMTELFGRSPRVAVLEVFAESPDEEFSVPDIVGQTGVSKRGVYIHVRRLAGEGVLRESKKEGKCQFFRLNAADKRAQVLPLLDAVFTLGRLEREINRDAAARGVGRPITRRGPSRPRRSRGFRTPT